MKNDMEKNFHLKLPKKSMSLLIIIMVMVYLWLFMGNINSKELSWGIFTKEIKLIKAPSEGIVLDCNVKEGSFIKEKCVIVKIKNIENEIKFNNINELLKKKQPLLESKKDIELSINKKNIEKYNHLIDKDIIEIKSKKESITRTIRKIENLKDDPTIAQIRVENLKKKLSDLRRIKGEIENRINTNQNNITDLKKKAREIEIDYIENYEKLKNEKQKFKDTSYLEIVPNYNGKVLEINIKKGGWVSKGEVLMTIEVEGQFQLIAYIQHIFGKKIDPENETHIYPTNLNKIKCNYLQGKIISETPKIPVSDEQMKVVLPNTNTINEFHNIYKGNNALSQLEISLNKDAYINENCNSCIKTGVFSSIYIVTDSKSPIEYLIPIKK